MTIDELIDLSERATAGPWVTDPEFERVVYCHDGGVAVVRSPSLYMDGDEENLEFIAAARTALPAALRTLRRIRESMTICAANDAIDAFERGEA